MTANRQQHDEFRDLLWSLEEGSISADGIDRIDELVRSDTELLRSYIEYLRLSSDLRLGPTNHHVTETLAGVFGNDEQGQDTSVPSEVIDFPIILNDQSAAVHSSCLIPHCPSLSSFVGGALFSYLTATLILGTALAIAWVWKLPDYAKIAQWQSPPTEERRQRYESESPMKFVGRITGMVDCLWADPNTAVPGPVAVPLGRKYALSAGLMEITYNTGAKVVLQGPCSYEVESAAGGYLSVGKLTARVESRESRVESNQTITKSQAADHSPLFAVRTPTATITDLGTEFGVSVESSGATETHVFQGRVEARLAGSAGEGHSSIRLEANQSARVDVEVDQKPAIRLTTANPSVFVRKFSKRVPIRLFSTGVGLKEGDPDPQWQLVAQSNEANFRPRPAIVVPAVPACWLANEPDRSQWISVLPGYSAVPDGVAYTFRTTFELADVQPETARLTGWFIVDNHVRAIRLNGHEVPVPRHERNCLTFDLFHKFTISEGFADGTNVLDIEVENGKTVEEAESSLMGLRVILEASARRQ